MTRTWREVGIIVETVDLATGNPGPPSDNPGPNLARSRVSGLGFLGSGFVVSGFLACDTQSPAAKYVSGFRVSVF